LVGCWTWDIGAGSLVSTADVGGSAPHDADGSDCDGGNCAGDCLGGDDCGGGGMDMSWGGPLDVPFGSACGARTRSPPVWTIAAVVLSKPERCCPIFWIFLRISTPAIVMLFGLARRAARLSIEKCHYFTWALCDTELGQICFLKNCQRMLHSARLQ
jgi:hypothetical protein